MVGEAFTLRYIPAREDLNPMIIFRDPKYPQRVAIETCPPGAVLLIDSRKNARAASGGGFRDSANIANLEIPSFHKQPSAPTNLTLHQAIDMNVPIGCVDVAVFPGDIIFGDDDGVMVIPAEIADEVGDECIEMTIFEDFVLKEVNNGKTIIGLYPPTNEQTLIDFDTWRKVNNL